MILYHTNRKESNNSLKNSLLFSNTSAYITARVVFMNYKDLIGQRVISIYDSKVDSYVIDAIFTNNKKLSKFVIVDMENENQKLLETQNVFKIGKGGILIRSSNKLIIAEYAYSKNLYMNKEVFDIQGNSLGKISDISLTQNLEIEQFLTTKNSFKPKQIINVDSIIIINTPNSNYKKSNFTPKKSSVAQTPSMQSVTIHTAKVPIKVLSSNSSLIGKRLFQDLKTAGNVVLARKNSLVTSSVLNLARQNGLMNELVRSVF